jgi:hypothetical protein
MRFISTLLIIYLIWQVVKFVFKIAFRYWLKKNGGKAFYYSGGFGQPGAREPRPEGEIRVDTFGPSKSSNPSPGTKDLGEYVDYEEVK